MRLSPSSPSSRKRFDVGKERVSSDTEVFANDFALDILSDEEDAVQLSADAWGGTSAGIVTNRFKVG